MGWDDWRWARAKAVVLLDNLACLQDELVILEAGEENVRKDKVLLEEPQVGEALEKLIKESLSAQWALEGNLEGDDLEREVVRRRGLHYLGVGRGWEDCVWCGELVGPRDWAAGRTCAHQIHTVSDNEHEQPSRSLMTTKHAEVRDRVGRTAGEDGALGNVPGRMPVSRKEAND